MWALGGSLIGLMLAAAPIGIALAGATILVVLSDPMLGPNALFSRIFSVFEQLHVDGHPVLYLCRVSDGTDWPDR